MGTTIGRTVVVLLWLLAFAVAGATGLEFFLRIRSHWHPLGAQADSTPRSHRFERAYAPFIVEHLHPQYFFFFPLDRAERAALSNETCSLDADGFRGHGPAYAGNRRLAFLLGGSSAFGLLATSDATTIAGYLNRLQDEYFFVNAGVPSWNSTQEMFRLAFQILDYHPALVVTYDGANDARLLDRLRPQRSDDAAGIPEDFDVLAAMVNERGFMIARRAMVSLGASLFPELTTRINGRMSRAARDTNDWIEASSPLPEGVLRAGVARYLSNLTRMHDLTTAQGGRFIAIFQPVAQLHRHLGTRSPIGLVNGIDEFHEAVLASSRGFEFHDLGNVLDEHYEAIPVKHPDVTDETVFLDEVHLYDPGNEIVARHLAMLIR